MKTNELKKGTRIELRCGWRATLIDNMRGNTRMATVEGIVTESGSIYAHDIVAYLDKNEVWQEDIVYTKSQLDCKKMANW